MPKEVMDTINTIKDKVKDIKKPEDIPQVADWAEECKKTVGSRTWRVIRVSRTWRIIRVKSIYLKFFSVIVLLFFCSSIFSKFYYLM